MTRAALLALLCLPLSARAEEKVKIERKGATFEFTVPTGWSTVEDDDQVTFVTPVLPSGQVSQVMFWVTSGSAKTPQQRLTEFADKMKRESRSVTLDAPVETTFLGAPGAQAAFKSSQAGFAHSGLFVVTRDADFNYFFTYGGLSSDMIAAEFTRGLQILRSSARRVKEKPAGPGEGTRAAKVIPPRREILDPAWGLEVKGLAEGWRIGVEPDGYVLFSAKPQATAILQRLSEAEAEKQLQRGRPVTGTFGSYPAVVMEGASAEGARQRSWFLRLPGRIVAVHFSSVTFLQAEALLGPLVKAVRFFDPVLEEAAGGGVGLELPHGLTLRLPRPWAVAGVGPEHATFRGPEGTTVKVRALRLEANEEDPFQDERYTQRRTCALFDLSFDEQDVAVPGASRAKRFRCQGKGRAALLYLLEARKGGVPVYVSVVAYYDKKAGRTPDGIAADFLSHLGMPR